jgi:hypothetical protein
MFAVAITSGPPEPSAASLRSRSCAESSGCSSEYVPAELQDTASGAASSEQTIVRRFIRRPHPEAAAARERSSRKRDLAALRSINQ